MTEPLVLLDRTAPPASLSEAVYDGILQLIVSGELPLNARLPSESRLSEIFKASRPIVRDALARLREDGLVVSRQGSGSYVTRQPDPAVLDVGPVGSIADIQRCFEFRAGVEPAAARLAAMRWNRDDMQRIDDAMAALERCVAEAVLGAKEDGDLHQAIANATHNHYHASVQQLLKHHIAAGMNLARSLSLKRPELRAREVQDEHVVVVDAVRRRDADAAGRLMEEHILKARQRMFEAVGQ